MRRTPLALLPVATLSLAVALIAGRTDTVDAATPQKGVVAQAAVTAPGTRMEAETPAGRQPVEVLGLPPVR